MDGRVFRLSQINVFPIKSLGVVRLSQAQITPQGLANDRRWMLVDQQGRFISQRECSQLSQFKVSLGDDTIDVQHRSDRIQLPAQLDSGQQIEVSIWSDQCAGFLADDDVNDWFSEQLSLNCRLVYMGAKHQRLVDPNFSVGDDLVSFADGFPHLIIGESSLQDLNQRLPQPVSMDRFRTNFVFTGGDAYAEDGWRKIRIGETVMRVVKPCARCTLTTADPETGEKGKEPLRTLASYRSIDGGVMFGQNLLHESLGQVAVGDRIQVMSD